MVERVYFLILVDGGFFFLFLFFVCLTCLYSGIRFCTHLMFIIEKKKEVAEQTVAFFIWFPQLWNYGH